MKFYTVLCRVVCHVRSCCIVLRCTVLYCAVMFYTVLCRAVLWYVCVTVPVQPCWSLDPDADAGPVSGRSAVSDYSSTTPAGSEGQRDKMQE